METTSSVVATSSGLGEELARSGAGARAAGALVRRVRPALESLGEYDRLAAELDRIAEQGNGAMRQLRAWRRRVRWWT